MRHMPRDLDRNHPAAPKPDDLPTLVFFGTDPTAFAAIGPASRIADSQRLGELAAQAFACSISTWVAYGNMAARARLLLSREVGRITQAQRSVRQTHRNGDAQVSGSRGFRAAS